MATTMQLATPWIDLARRANRFLDAGPFRQGPRSRWTTPNEVVHETDAFRLREFSLPPGVEAAPPTRHPILVVPPEVNRSYVVDFGPEQSLVARLLQAGFRRVLVVDWRSPEEAETRARDIDDSVAAILECIDLLGGRAHLLGVCQGGWESAIAAALEPGKLVTLTLVAAPIDFAAGDGLVKQVAETTPMAFYRGLVGTTGGVMRGELISAGFDNLLVFERYWLKYLSLWNNLDDPAWLGRFQRLDDWYRAPKALPGPLYLRAVRELFKENRLIRGRFVCLGRRVDLGRISCPLGLVAGARDHITPPPQLLAARDAVSSTEVLEVETAGGHIGSFMGRQELAESWPGLLDWLCEQEKATPSA